MRSPNLSRSGKRKSQERLRKNKDKEEATGETPVADRTSLQKSTESIPLSSSSDRVALIPTSQTNNEAASDALRRSSETNRLEAVDEVRTIAERLVSQLEEGDLSDWGWQDYLLSSTIDEQTRTSRIHEAELALEAEELALDLHGRVMKEQSWRLGAQDESDIYKLHLVGQDYLVGLGKEGRQLRNNDRRGFVLIGTSCLGNLELIKQIRGSNDAPPHLIIADFSHDVSQVWDALKVAIFQSESLDDMRAKILRGLKDFQAQDYDKAADFLAELIKIDGTTFESSEQLHEFFRAVAIRAIMVPCNYAVQNSLAYVTRARDWAESQEGTYAENIFLYTSNIFPFLRDEEAQRNMLETVRLFGPRAIIATDLNYLGQPSRSLVTVINADYRRALSAEQSGNKDNDDIQKGGGNDKTNK